MAVRKSDRKQSQVSDAIELTIHGEFIIALLLSVSPSPWLRVGDSAMLSCEIQGSSEDWTYYWYRTIPYKDGLPSPWTKRFSMEMLPDVQHGTHGPLSFSNVSLKHIDVYACRAGRGNPEFFTEYSTAPELLWVSASSPRATLRVSPNRVQHFADEAYSVSCEAHGNSTGWKVKRFIYDKGQSECGTEWGTMTGSSCYINNTNTSEEPVYWCQSDSGEYSDAANITESVVLESPILPVPEGQSVKLGCRHKTLPSNHRAEFYRYDKLIGSAKTGEMIIWSVSKSDEGRYWCTIPDLGESSSSCVVTPTPILSLYLALNIHAMHIQTIMVILYYKCIAIITGS
uniref:Ig-like domain-containing protein n=1 Tax=Myripristis murdjan TaxID=586833 RepID=A0A667WTT7_9TELE